MKYALILDTETTGLDPALHKCIEVAVILYDLVHASPVASYGSLLHSDSNEAEAINRIPVGVLRNARDPDSVWNMIRSLATYADVIIAHRAEFDEGFCPKFDKPWVCSKTAIEWPMAKTGEHLVHLALAHGIGVVSAHRAMTDVDIIARLLTRVAETGHSLPDMIKRAMRPRVKVAAIVSYDDRELAKSAGFQWDPQAKKWWKTMFAEDVAKLGFKTAEIAI